MSEPATPDHCAFISATEDVTEKPCPLPVFKTYELGMNLDWTPNTAATIGLCEMHAIRFDIDGHYSL